MNLILPKRFLRLGTGDIQTLGGGGSGGGGLTSPLTTKGDIWGFDTGNNRVPVGADGTVLTADSTQALGVKYATPAAAGMVKIAQVVTTGSATTITFSSIPATYTDLLVVMSGHDTNSGGSDFNVFVKLNGDATAANYTATQGTFGTGGAVASTSTASSTNGAFILKIPGVSGDANAMGGGTVTIPNYAATSFWKFVYATGGQNGGTLQNHVANFRWKSTAAVTSLTFTAGGTAFADGTTATLYGLG